MAMNQAPQSPGEQVGGSGGTIDQQFRIAQASLNYNGRFSPATPGPGATNNDYDRWANADRASGRK
jgi:hypothetical protein